MDTTERRALLAELGVAAVGLAVGVVAMVCLIYAPRIFFGTYGLSSGLPVFFEQVGATLVGLIRGDFGTGVRAGRVGPELAAAARRSAELLAVSMGVALPLGLAWGAGLAAPRRALAGPLFGLNVLALALPSFVLLVLGVEAAVSLGQRLGVRLAPTNGYGFDSHLLLPAGALALRGAAFFARVAHAAQDHVLRQDYIRFARARGLGGLRLWRGHVLPAMRAPLLGGALGALRVMVGGLVIVEWIYNWNGLGDKLLTVGRLGARPDDIPIAAGAGALLVVGFVVVDTLARLAQRRLGPVVAG